MLGGIGEAAASSDCAFWFAIESKGDLFCTCCFNENYWDLHWIDQNRSTARRQSAEGAKRYAQNAANLRNWTEKLV
jgi:hypothetical protein